MLESRFGSRPELIPAKARVGSGAAKGRAATGFAIRARKEGVPICIAERDGDPNRLLAKSYVSLFPNFTRDSDRRKLE